MDRVGIIQSGQLMDEGSVEDLRKRHGGHNATLEEVFLNLVGHGDRHELAA